MCNPKKRCLPSRHNIFPSLIFHLYPNYPTPKRTQIVKTKEKILNEKTPKEPAGAATAEGPNGVANN